MSDWDSAHWLITAGFACLTSETANKWPHKKREPVWKKRKALGAQHSLRGLESATTTLSLQSHFDTQAKTIQKTSAPKDATFKQLNVLHKEHPQSSIRAGEVWFHHGEKCGQVCISQVCFVFFRFSYNQPSVIVFPVVCMYLKYIQRTAKNDCVAHTVWRGDHYAAAMPDAH